MFLNYKWALGQNCRAGAAGFGQILARRLTGSEGQGGGKGEEAEAHLLLCLVRGNMVRGGLSMAGGGELSRVVGDGVGRPVLGVPLGRGAASGGQVWSMWGWGGGTTAR
jgi:hypothetical protein